MMNEVLILDYGMGNIESLKNAFLKIDCNVKISNDPNKVKECKKLILPGVGAFNEAMQNISNFGLIDVIREIALDDKKNILGICLGMQILASKGYENKECEGLNLIPGEVKLMKRIYKKTLIPHIGFNEVKKTNSYHKINKNLYQPTDFYFVHSYSFTCSHKDNCLGVTKYDDINITSIIGKNNIIGVQFHPEKSQNNGLNFLKNFLEL